LRRVQGAVLHGPDEATQGFLVFLRRGPGWKVVVGAAGKGGDGGGKGDQGGFHVH
jgi:hypothetical protein